MPAPERDVVTTPCGVSPLPGVQAWRGSPAVTIYFASALIAFSGKPPNIP